MHPCDKSHSHRTPHQDHQQDGDCGHEEGCAADPCSMIVMPNTDSKSTQAPDDSQAILALVALSDVVQNWWSVTPCIVTGHGFPPFIPPSHVYGCALPLLI